MQIQRPNDFLSFADGVAEVWDVKDRFLIKQKEACVHFSRSTVGERRFWDAYTSGIIVNTTVYVPLGTDVEYGDVMVIGGKQYQVAQKDRKDTLPESWLLSLQASPIEYRKKVVIS